MELKEEIEKEDLEEESRTEDAKVCTITSKDLINEEDFTTDDITCPLSGSPYIYIKVDKDLYEMLVDSGAEISTMSVTYEESKRKRLGKLPTLPLTGISIHNALGNKPIKVEKQIGTDHG